GSILRYRAGHTARFNKKWQGEPIKSALHLLAVRKRMRWREIGKTCDSGRLCGHRNSGCPCQDWQSWLWTASDSVTLHIHRFKRERATCVPAAAGGQPLAPCRFVNWTKSFLSP